MTKPEDAVRLAEIAASIAPVLKETGYSKRGHLWNRRLESGLVHVVEIDAGPRGWALPVSKVETEPLRYGSYVLEFGVYAAELDFMDRGRAWIPAVACAVLGGMDDLTFGRGDGRLWPTSGDDEAAPALMRPGRPWASLWEDDAGAVAKSAMMSYGLPWLSRFVDHDDIVAAFLSGDSLGLVPPNRARIAKMLARLGRDDEALEILDAAD